MIKLKLAAFSPAVVLAALLASGCTHGAPPPKPPSPPPAPQNEPLVAQADGTWARAGKPWVMRMVVVCCKGFPDADPRDLAKENNWPLTSKEFTQWISFHKQNATEIRLLMEPIDEHGDLFSPYLIATPDKRVDLTQWNPAFWSYVDDLIADGDKKGVVFMVGPIDTWQVDHGMSPWCGKYNVNGVNFCDSGILRGGFHELGQRFARKSFEELGKHKNVIFMDGNESFEAMSGAWTIGQRDLLRQVEAERGYVRHPYGTQQRDDGLRAQVDFVAAEYDGAIQRWCGGAPRTCKPTVVNESSLRTPADVLRQVYKADTLGSSFAFWMGELNQDQRGQTLIALQGWAEGKPIPSWAAAAASCPTVARIAAHVQIHVCNNQQSPEPCVGGSTVIDSTPRYGPVGSNGKECNDEHDNCGGRTCEPPDGPTWEWSAPPGVRCYVQNFAHCEDTCTAVPCTEGHGYQLKCENQRPGDYEATPIMRDARDCEGVFLIPRLTRGETVRWTVN